LENLVTQFVRLEHHGDVIEPRGVRRLDFAIGDQLVAPQHKKIRRFAELAFLLSEARGD
jgi:hypothetical protein